MLETLPMLIAINLLLLSRLRLMFRDDGAGQSEIFKMAAIRLPILLTLGMGAGWFILLAYIVLSPVVDMLFEKRSERIYRNRIWSLLIHVSLLISIYLFAPEVSMSGSLGSIISETGIFSADNFIVLQLYLLGGLMVMNEINFLIRYLMFLLNLAPIGQQKTRGDITEQQYNTGRVIGMLERLFIYSFALGGQFTAIGFILTAKGVVRYRDFEERGFAEYVLIGTLLSALLAMGAALIIRVTIHGF